MASTTYHTRRAQLATYFDATALDAWAKLTSDAPVSRIRATVRAGRAAMRATLLSYLPDDLRGARVLDAGCGTGALAIEAARRGAEVVAIDLSPKLVALAAERAPADVAPGRIAFRAGDMLDPELGVFDHIVAMDSLIHYRAPDIVRVLGQWAPRARVSLVVTFAPRTAALSLMHAGGKLFPRADRSPAIEPVRHAHLARRIARAEALEAYRLGRTQRISSGFYISQALEVTR